MMPQGITRSLPGNASGHHPVPAGECLKASPILKGLKTPPNIKILSPAKSLHWDAPRILPYFAHWV